MVASNEEPGNFPGGPTGIASPGVPNRREEQAPVAYADRMGECYAAGGSGRQRKAHGLFLTPVPAAHFVDVQIAGTRQMHRLFDPAAGTGILCRTSVEALGSRCQPASVIEIPDYMRHYDGERFLGTRLRK